MRHLPLLILLIALRALGAADPAQPDNPGTAIYPASATRHVAVDGNDANDGTTPQKAWRTLQKAAATVQAGQLVLVGPGDYRPVNDTWNNLNITRSGSASAYITFRAQSGTRPRIWVDTWNGIQLWNVAYVEFDGFEVRGMDDPVTVDVTNPAHFGGGITVAGSSGCHHLRIRNCVVHHCGGNGIGASGDQILVEGNTVYHCSHRSDAGNSGISAQAGEGPFPAPRSGYGIVIRNNLCFDNVNRFGFKYYYNKITDGNGIICDYWPDQGSTTGYDRRTLITGNVCFANGGRGIHCFHYHQVDIINNTVWGNLTNLPEFPNEGELSAVAAEGVQVVNNIAIAADGRKPINLNGTGTTSSSNILFAARLDGWDLGVGDRNADPGLVAAVANPALADWHLTPSSICRETGVATFNAVLVPDRDGDRRPQGVAVDLGADEVSAGRAVGVTVWRSGLMLATLVQAWQDGSLRYEAEADEHHIGALDAAADTVLVILALDREG